MFEYAEEYASVDDGWTELMNHYADDGWRLHTVVPDVFANSFTTGKNTILQFRLIFERKRAPEDE